MKSAYLIAAVLLGLAACTEKPQELHSNAALAEPEYMGTGTNFVAPGWTQGDRNSWVQHLKVRTQRGQNEYLKIH